MTALDAATEYNDRGWQPLPVPARSKAPNMEGWQNFRCDEDGLGHHFNGEDQNVGVLLGNPSGGLVDVDLDCTEAVALAAAFLPDTDTKFGRKSKRASHWLYVSPGAATRQFKLATDCMVVELRSTGGQTVFPGSVHPTGEEIQWERGCDGDPAMVDASELTQHVNELAAAAVVLRCWPKEGGRHDAVLALTGSLLRNGCLHGPAEIRRGAHVVARL